MSADLRARIKWLMLTRAILATILSAGLVLLQLWFQASDLWGIWLSAIGPILLVSYGVNFISWPFIKQVRAPLVFIAYSHLLIDLCTCALVIWYTGKLNSPVSFLLPVCVLFGATLFERTGAWVSATLGIGAIFVISLLEGAEIDFLRLTDTTETLRRLILSGLIQVGIISLVATLAAHLSERLKTAHLRLQIVDRDLRTLRRLNERMLTRSQSGVIHLSQQGKVLFMNQAAGHLLALDPLLTLNQVLFEIVPWLIPKDEIIEEAYIPSLADARYWESERSLGQLTLACALSPIEEDDESVEGGAALILQDITSVKQRQRDDARRAHLASMGELTAQVAHELRNPLASIRSSLQLLERMSHESNHSEVQQKTQKRLLSILDRETDRLAQLTQSFLDVARPPEPHPFVTPIMPILKELCILTSHAPFQTLLISKEEDFLGCTAWVDPDHLQQILLNLIKNAHESYDIIESKSSISIKYVAFLKVDRLEDRVYIHVLDEGVGLPHDIEDLFTPFKTTKDRGSGLGLALSRSLAESNHATLTGQNRPITGAQFTLSLLEHPKEYHDAKPQSDMLIQVLNDDR